MENFQFKIKEVKMEKIDIDNAIAETCVKIIKEPLLYFSEADVQQMLAEELKLIEGIRDLYPTLIHRGKDSKSFYSTTLLHREYGGGGGTRIDIVIFSKEDTGKIDNQNLKIGNKYITPEFAFELGTEKTGNIKEHLENDIKKLKNVKKTGYIIHIYKDITKSQSDTKSREATIEKITNIFKKVFENDSKNCSNRKIKKLAILLNPFRNQTKIWGKCEIFNGDTCKWEKVNVDKKTELKGKIIDQLK